jgi:release factor glutamine methyltransferase
LKDRAQVFLEIGAGQGLAVQKIFSGGPWIRAEVEKDWAGHDRFFFLEK